MKKIYKTILYFKYKCVGCGNCYLYYKKHFIISKKSGKAILINGEKKNKYYIKKIYNKFDLNVKICPLNIIKII
ncbi:MAG: hypothetical protein ABNO50_00990 [Candidatus Shikimatogenerans sp. Tduv]|uniref:4Fe-4S ferredoxin-type domain-containing protein n=1 Tax=Candidatus Shikimatogenerans sp. Tduv TaxID=3158567 RepID=A0AAU7QRQ8_9FLAO